MPSLNTLENIHLLTIHKLDVLMIIILIMTALMGVYYYLLLNESILNSQMVQTHNTYIKAYITYNNTNNNITIRYY